MSEQSSSTLSTPAELLRSNENLRAELARVRAANLELRRRLHAARLGMQADREVRRAALNLMEDAIMSRHVALQENAERRRVEDQLRQANQRKDEFLATLGHELRTPLTPIRNNLYILKRTGDDADMARRLHDMMERQLNHIVRLVDDLLEVSRITRGKIELRREWVLLDGIVSHAIDISKPAIGAARHQLSVELPSEPVMLDADPVRLTQVLANLLNNAARYTPPAGRIWIKAVRMGESLEITVGDTGIGLTPEMLPKIFELFSRGNEQADGGLGIGLTLARNLVELHGGSIEAHSEGPGLGSEFVIRLPAELQPALPKPTSVPTNLQEPALERVLVVDDNCDAADSLSLLVSELGADVHTVYDGRTALAELQAFRPQVVLMDISMPGMDGTEVARRARLTQEGREAALVAISGRSQEDDCRRAREAGFDQYLIKPVDIDALQTALRRGMDQAADPADQ